jgi:sulfite reductase alpha subunit-like flavoprotein
LKEAFKPDIFDIYVAFERERSKEYLQDVIAQQAEGIGRLVIEQGAGVYVCGDAKPMAKDVFKTMAQVLAEHGRSRGDIREAETYLRKLKKVNRWSEDVC